MSEVFATLYSEASLGAGDPAAGEAHMNNRADDSPRGRQRIGRWEPTYRRPRDMTDYWGTLPQELIGQIMRQRAELTRTGAKQHALHYRAVSHYF
jgi:hypothetical protein